MSSRNAASFGKRQEYRVIGELLARGFDVYMTLVDDQGIDCVLRFNENRYADIQIKARSKQAKTQYGFPGLSFIPRDNFFYIFFFERNKEYWVIPSAILAELCNKSRGRYDFSLPKTEKKLVERDLLKFRNEDGFKVLERYGKGR